MPAVLTLSGYIDRLVALAEEEGLRVECHARDLPPGVAGRIHYADRLIEINAASALVALLALAHELGHWFSYRRLRHRYDRLSDSMVGDAEMLAYLYGWFALRRVGADARVSKAAWRFFHRYELGLPVGEPVSAPLEGACAS